MLNFMNRDSGFHNRKYGTVPYAGLPYGPPHQHQPYLDGYDRPLYHNYSRRRSWPDQGAVGYYDGVYEGGAGLDMEIPDEGIYDHYPQIHELLAANTTPVVFDIRASVHDQLRQAPNSLHRQHYGMPATQTGATTVRIISKEFPWSFDIKSGSGGPVTVQDLLQGIYIGLQGRLTDTEWGGADEVRKRAIERANTARRAMPVVDRPKRIDWLGHRVFFAGLVHDEVFAQRCLAPGRHPCQETWVVRFRG